jgi:hypothetical protein
VSKAKVTVIGGNPTSAKRALELISRGRAKYVDEHTIELVSSPLAETADERSPVAPAPRHSPRLGRVVQFRPDTFTGQTFLHYPQPEAFRHRRERPVEVLEAASQALDVILDRVA